MNLTLLRKELTALRMIVLMAVGLLVIGTVEIFATRFPDEEPFSVDEVDPFSIIFGMLIGLQALGQERELRTQNFMDGLPVSRWSVFIHKTIAAFMVVAFVVIQALASSLFFGWLSHTSQSQEVRWDNVLTMNSMRFLLGITTVTVSMFLSYSRQWFPLLAGLLFWGCAWLRSTGSEWAPWFDSAAMFHPAIDQSNTMLVPWTPVEGHAGICVAAWILAGICFNWRDGRLTLLIDRIAAWRFSAWAVGLGKLAAVAVWIMALFAITKDQEPPTHRNTTDSAAGTPKASNSGGKESHKRKSKTSEVVAFATQKTKHYEIVFRESQREKFVKYWAGLDQEFDVVARYFQDPPLAVDSIVVDVASFVVPHAAGQTNWTKIRIPLDTAGDATAFRQILRHETAHVFIEQLSQGLAGDHFNAMRAFHEGVATAVELSPNDDHTKSERLAMEQWAAGAVERGKVPLETLCDDSKLSNERDPAIAYPLGYVFAQSLIEAGGPTLPRKLLESLHDSPPVTGARPTELWRHALQQCGTSFDRVISIYEQRLKTLHEREKSFIARYPRIKGKVTTEGDDIVIHAEPEHPAPGPAKIVCMVQNDLGIAQMPESIVANPDGTFHLRRAAHSGNKVKYMLGWQAANLHYPWFEPWTNEVVK